MGKKRIVLCALLLVWMLALAACSGGDEVKQPAAVNGSTAAVSEAEMPEENAQSEAENTVDVEVTVAETVLYDADGIKVTVTGYEENWVGPEVKVLVENSSDRNALITAQSVSVNGYMMPYAGMYAEVAAGKKANEKLSLSFSELERSGIETVAEIQFYIKVSDADNWDTLATSELLTVNTSAAGFEQPVDDSGDVLYDSNGIRVICKGLKQDVIWDGTIVFYMENNSGVPVSVYAENVSVNGFMEDASLWSDMRDGTRIVDGMSLLDLSDLELESIDEVESIEFNLRIVNSESWDKIATTDVITLTFG